MQNNTKLAIQYGAKRFALYFLTGVIISTFLNPVIMIFAAPCVLLASIAMAIVDAYRIKTFPDLNEPLAVFNKMRIGLLITLVILAVATYMLLKKFVPDFQFPTVYISFLIVSIIFCILFFTVFSDEIYLNRAQYGRERFLGYLFLGLTASFFPAWFIGVFFGFPVILLGSVLLAATDLLSLPPDSNASDIDSYPVFNRMYLKVFLGLVMIDIVYGITTYLYF